MKITVLSFVLLSLTAPFAHADEDGAYLDPAYTHLIHPKVNLIRNKGDSKNDVAEVISKQTPVRSQEARGTCSIFSATAYLEGLLVQKGLGTIDTLNLSEEWLQYTVNRNTTRDGSSAPRNFNAIKNFGMPIESTLPYIGQDWVTTYSPLRDSRCGHLTGDTQKSCYIVHRDPSLLTKTDKEIVNSTLNDEEFVAARKEAFELRDQKISFTNQSVYLNDTNKIKSLLKAGTPVVLEIDFYYGAWNHRAGEALGLERNVDHWNKGIVTSPEVGSLDQEKSPTKPAGHSVLVVGYDDNRVVTKEIQMADGTRKEFTYKGVYYIKNSWGTSSFGKDFEIAGKNYPGYGMIVQKHADAKGSFFYMPLKSK